MGTIHDIEKKTASLKCRDVKYVIANPSHSFIWSNNYKKCATRGLQGGVVRKKEGVIEKFLTKKEV